MSIIKGDFNDANKFMIVDGVICYSGTGNSYLDKFKHKIPLDLVLDLEYSALNLKEMDDEVIEEDYKQFEPL